MNGNPLSFFQTTEPVKVVANNTLPDNPLITALADEHGVPKVDNNGNPLGSIRLEQHSRTLNGSFLNPRRRVAFISGTIEMLEGIVKAYNLKDGSTVPGKIKITESLEPMWRNQTPKINPQSKEQVGITVNGQFYPVYSQMIYTDNMQSTDRLIRNADDVIEWLTSRQLAAATQNMANVETSRVPTTDEVDSIVGA